jgi:peptidyl-prolyl cis-trans isomerase A (cyclophilin A)
VVVAGTDVVDAIERVPTGRNDKPVTDVVVNSVTVEQAGA